MVLHIHTRAEMHLLRPASICSHQSSLRGEWENAFHKSGQPASFPFKGRSPFHSPRQGEEQEFSKLLRKMNTSYLQVWVWVGACTPYPIIKKKPAYIIINTRKLWLFWIADIFCRRRGKELGLNEWCSKRWFEVRPSWAHITALRSLHDCKTRRLHS